MHRNHIDIFLQKKGKYKNIHLNLKLLKKNTLLLIVVNRLYKNTSHF